LPAPQNTIIALPKIIDFNENVNASIICIFVALYSILGVIHSWDHSR